MRSWPTAVQGTLDDPWPGSFQQLQVRLPRRNHTLDEAGCGLFMNAGQAEQVSGHTTRVVSLTREGDMVRADDPPGPG